MRPPIGSRPATGALERAGRRTATTCFSRASSCSDGFVVIERALRLPCCGCAPWPATAGRALRRLRRAGLHAWPRQVNPEPDSRRLRYGYTSLTTPSRSTTTTCGRRERRCSSANEVLGGYRSRRLRDRAAHGRRRATARRCRSRWSTARASGTTASAAAALRLRLLRLKHGPALQLDVASACSTAASSTPSPTSAAARRWAAPGTTTASC